MRFTLYFLLFLFTNIAFSQHNFVLTDQEYQKLHDKSRLLINSNADSSFILATRIEKSNNNLHKSFAYGIKSYLYQLKGDSIKSKQSYKQAFTFLDKIPSSIEKTKLNSYLLNYGGLAEWKRGNLSNALIRYQEGKKLSEKVEDIKQVLKFNNNISYIYKDATNFELAIKILRENDKITDDKEYLFEVDEFYNLKSLLNLNLGSSYIKIFSNNLSKVICLDSSAFYYKKAIVYSKYIENTKTLAQMGLANVYLLKKDYKTTSLLYNKLIIETKNNNFNYSIVNYSVGRLYYETNKFDKSLIHFKRVDSIFKLDGNNTDEFVYSNYFQAKIYAAKKDYENASKHSKIYLEEFKKQEANLNKEALGINNILSATNLNKEMVALQKAHKNDKLWRGLFLFVLVSLIILLFFRNNVEKNRATKKVKILVEEFKKQETLNKTNEKNRTEKTIEIAMEVEKKEQKSVLVLDSEKENEILERLQLLIHKEDFLKEDFTQQYVAKKIKTNTTYLSYVINKNFKKTFSEYANELKINYVISQMISNPTYRKYSTQAIAESVGFKNASSFTKSFHKKTGVTPVQFAKNIKI